MIHLSAMSRAFATASRQFQHSLADQHGIHRINVYLPRPAAIAQAPAHAIGYLCSHATAVIHTASLNQNHDLHLATQRRKDTLAGTVSFAVVSAQYCCASQDLTTQHQGLLFTY